MQPYTRSPTDSPSRGTSLTCRCCHCTLRTDGQAFAAFTMRTPFFERLAEQQLPWTAIDDQETPSK